MKRNVEAKVYVVFVVLLVRRFARSLWPFFFPYHYVVRMHVKLNEGQNENHRIR